MIESDEDEEIIPPTPEPEAKVTKGRKRSQKKVRKTYKDAKGYMVTKEVLESCSESDNEEETKASKPEPVVKEPTTKAKKSAGPSPKKQQASIMNFFKKKVPAN